MLVHDYAEIHLPKVHAALSRLDDFSAFLADIEGWLTSTGG